MIFKGDRLNSIGACPDAFAAADAGDPADFHGDDSLVPAHAVEPYPPVFDAARSEFDQVARAGLHAGPATDAAAFIHNGQTGLRIDVNGVKSAGRNAVAKTQAAVRAFFFAAEQGMRDGAFLRTLILESFFRHFNGAAAVNDRHHRFRFGNFQAQKFADALHRPGAAHRTHQSGNASLVGRGNQGLGQAAAARKTAGAAIHAGKHFRQAVDAGIFFRFECFGGKQKQKRRHGSRATQKKNGEQDDIIHKNSPWKSKLSTLGGIGVSGSFPAEFGTGKHSEVPIYLPLT